MNWNIKYVKNWWDKGGAWGGDGTQTNQYDCVLYTEETQEWYGLLGLKLKKRQGRGEDKSVLLLYQHSKVGIEYNYELII